MLFQSVFLIIENKVNFYFYFLIHSPTLKKKKKKETTNFKNLSILIYHIFDGCKFLHLLLLNKAYLSFFCYDKQSMIFSVKID